MSVYRSVANVTDVNTRRALLYAANFVGGGFFGWAVDTAYRSIIAGHYVPGTMLPYFSLIFAFGAVMLFALFSIRSVPFWPSIFLGALLCVALELVCGLVAYFIFHHRFWDYTGKPFNFLGLIDLEHGIYWLLLTFLYRVFYKFIR